MHSPRADRLSIAHQHHQLRGPTSFGLHDPARVFEALDIQPGDYFVDIGCGPGDYSLAAAEVAGDTGRVLALDKSQKSVEQLMELAVSKGLSNLNGIRTDITRPLPFADCSVQGCLISAVLYIIRLNGRAKALFKECHRILDYGGRLSIIECKKEDQPWGPPLEMRLAPEEIEAVVVDYGFSTQAAIDLGKTYLIKFNKE